MMRLLRILLHAATVLSLVLCVATMAAWVRSYRVPFGIGWSQSNPLRHMRIVTFRGGLLAEIFTPVGIVDGWDLTAPVAADWDSHGTFFNRLGFVFDQVQNNEYVLRQLACPYWFIALLTAILPAARLVAWRRRARRLRMRPGLCQHCGYDCRATPDRCPECGRETKAAKGAA